MPEYQVTKSNLVKFMEDIQDELDVSPVLVVTTQSGNVGKWGLARLWRAWMDSTAKYMAGNGVTMPLCISKTGKYHGTRLFNANDAHELFTCQHLALDDNGLRLSWAKSGESTEKGVGRKATKGERFIALQRHEMWASDRGVILFKPRDSEYSKLTEEQEK